MTSKDKDTKIMKYGDDVMVRLGWDTPTYIKSKFKKSGDDVMKVNHERQRFGFNNLKMDSDGRYTIDMISGKIIKVDGDQYLIGFNELYDWENKSTYVKGNPSTFKTPHDYYPSFPRTNDDGEIIEWEICEYGCWIHRDDFYLLGGFVHYERLLKESKEKINVYENKVSTTKDWIIELESRLKELETTMEVK